jgi:hypothetical protein
MLIVEHRCAMHCTKYQVWIERGLRLSVTQILHTLCKERQITYVLCTEKRSGVGGEVRRAIQASLLENMTTKPGSPRR